MPQNSPKSGHTSGFSLLQLSFLLVIGGLMLAATLPGGGTGDELARARLTMERMAKIEAATQQFMSANQRLPYPSDITAAFSAAAFGAELAVPTDYSSIPSTHFTTASTSMTSVTTTADTSTITKAAGWGSTITKNWMVSGTGIRNYTWIEGINPAASPNPSITLNQPASAAGTNTLYFRNPLVAGGVPVKALGLPDEVALDGYGRRIIYMVDQRATFTAGCNALQNNRLRGALALSNSSTFSSGTYDHVMWALLSYGKDGQGGVSAQGATLSNRVKAKNTDASTLNNAFSDGTSTTYTPLGLVNKAPTSTFDDIVWTSDSTKNTCSLARSTSTKDFRVNGGGAADSTASAAFGDVNGDTYPDLIYGIPQQSVVRVIFGNKYGWTEPPTAYTSSGVDGVTGFTIARGTVTSGFGAAVAAGDVNGDGYDDIIACSSTGGAGCAIIFGGSAWPATYTVGTTTTPTTAIVISGMYASVTPAITVGDVNGDSYADFALPYDAGSSNWAVGLVYGKASSWASFTLGNAYLVGTAATGVYFNVGTPNASNGDVSFGRTGGSDLAKQLLAVCDVDSDGYKDLIVPGVIIDATISPQRMYVVLGQTGVWTNSSGLVDVSTSTKSKQLTFPTLAAGASPTNDIKGLGCKDINSDGYEDIITYLKNNSTSQEYLFTYLGRTSFAAADVNANYDIRFDLTASAPSWQDSASIPRLTFGDINNDGRKDMILSRSGDDPYISISGSTFSVNSTATGTSRANAGISYVLYQPSTCYTSTCWGSLPNLNKGFFSNYTYDGTSGIQIVGGVTTDGMAVEGAIDMNKDNKDDLILSSGVSPTGGYFIFGKTTWPTAYDLLCTRDTSGGNCDNQITAR